MTLGVQISLVAGILFLVADAVVLVKMVRLVKKCENRTVEELGKLLNPYLFAASVFSVLLAVCMILVVVPAVCLFRV